MRHPLSWVALLITLATLTLTQPLHAADGPEFVPKETVPTATSDKAHWKYSLVSSGNVQFNSSRSVVGQNDEDAFTLGLNINGKAQYITQKHEWRNTLSLSESFSRTSVLKEWVKSGDDLRVESVYLYSIRKWFGAFARAAVQTALFEGNDIRAELQTYRIGYQDGTSQEVLASKLQLTDPFKPYTLKEAIGLWARPVEKEAINVEFRLGAGARHTFAKGQLNVADNGATPEIEVAELRSYFQAGAEYTFEVWGAVPKRGLTYKVKGEFLTPFYDELSEEFDDDKSAMELTNIDLEALLSLQIVKWASLDYKFRALKEPRILDEFQITHQLLLSFTVNLVSNEG